MTFRELMGDAYGWYIFWIGAAVFGGIACLLGNKKDGLGHVAFYAALAVLVVAKRALMLAGGA